MGNKNKKFFDDLSKGATWSAGVAFKRSNPLPLDRYSVFETKALAEAYATSNAVAYPGQVIAVAEGNKMVAYVLAENTAGDALVLQQIGIIPTGDNKTIDVTEDGVISLLAADTEVFKKDAEGNPTEEKEINAGAQLVLQANGTLKWVKPDTTTVEGLSTAVEDLKGRMTTAETDIDALELAIGAASKPESSEGAGDGKEATGIYAAIEAETARATAAEKALTDADTALDTAVKAAQKTADDTKARVDAFLDTEGLADTIDSLKDIKDELEALTDATELANAVAVKADKVTGATAGHLAGLDADGNLTDSGKKATDFATPADVKAVDDKLANYYTKEEIAGLNHATKSEVETAVAAEAEIARAAEKANADAITAIKDHETVDSFADVVAELAKKQDKLAEGAYATESYVTGQINTLKTVDIANAAAKGQKGIDDAATAQGTANEAKGIAEGAAAKAGTNEINLANLTAVVQGEGGHASQISGLAKRVGTAEGTIATHTEDISKNTTAAANAQAQADEALRVANLKTTMADVEAKGYAVAEIVNAEIAKKTTMAEVEAKGYAVAETVDADLAKKADKETTYSKKDIDGLIAPLATTEALNAVKATADAAAVKADVDAKFEALDAIDADYKTRIEKMETFWNTTAEPDAVVDTLKEIQNYIANDETGASNMLAAIEANEEAIAAETKARTEADAAFETRVAANETAVSETLPAAIAAAEKAAKDHADAEIAKVDTGVMSVTSLHDAIVVTPGENGAITINFADEIILNGGGANVAAE